MIDLARHEVIALSTRNLYSSATFFTYYHPACYHFPTGFLARMARTDDGWYWTEWYNEIGTVKRWARIIERAEIADGTACSRCGGCI